MVVVFKLGLEEVKKVDCLLVGRCAFSFHSLVLRFLHLLPTPGSTRFYLRPAVLSTAMEPFEEHNPKQASHAKSTFEEIK